MSGLKSGDLRPRIAKTFPFDKIADAHRYIESGDQFGKVVLTVSLSEIDQTFLLDSGINRCQISLSRQAAAYPSPAPRPEPATTSLSKCMPSKTRDIATLVAQNARTGKADG